jgi:putative transcriptional regulator
MDLTGQLLIAMPGMSDPRFSRSVVFICAYSEEGAMGLIVNKHARGITLSEVFSRLDLTGSQAVNGVPVHIGGPVETERGFVLHRDRARLTPDTLMIGDGYVVTATQDILKDIAIGEGPDPVLFALGYSGWGPGQLEKEIGQNGWLTAAATPELVFGAAHDAMWESALGSIGIDPITLSGVAGRA